ncbi:MAG: PA14 domain-containing protein [Fuerstiella sp.]
MPLPLHTVSTCVLRLLPLIFLLATSPALAEEVSRGEKLFKQHCADCHGVQGEGTPDTYPEKLFGDQPTIDLAEYISDAMPEGEPEVCTGEDAKAVAEWMQRAFYSPEAQARLNPPQRSLSRLTVSQYRNSVADLVESFLWTAQPGEERGLQARYYKSRNFRDKEKVIERVDPVIDFNFGKGTPDAEKIPDAEQFSIRWQGSVIIQESGWYEFILKTENGGRLYINDTREPLIDAWVKSGYDKEYRGTRYLLAGRIYPVTVEWFTFKEETASIGLWWKRPHGLDEPIPARHLTTQNSPPVLVVESPFPPDDRSDGYIRGIAVSKAWDDATTMAAIETVDRLSDLVGSLAKINGKDDEAARVAKLKQFCQTFAFRAFRRPLDEAQTAMYIDQHFADNDAPTATRRSLLAILKSPRFLYREVTGEEDAFTVAERLSFALLDSTPSATLLQAAQKGWIKSDKGLRDQAWKMVNSFRGKSQLMEFFRVWLNLERLEEIGKDSELYPDFTPEVLADLRTSLDLTLKEAASRDDGFQYLLNHDEFWMNARLAEFYQQPDAVSASENSTEFSKVKFESDKRAGVTSHPFLLSGLAYNRTSSPIHRGVFLSRGILGRALKPPPDSVSPLAPDLEPHLNTRERVIKQTSPALCSNCHKMINSLGFALENFDAVGRYRDTEKDRPIDSSGYYRLRTGETVEFTGAKQLAQFLVESHETRRSVVRQLFHFMVQQPILAYGPNSIDEFAEYFSSHNLNLKELMVEMACRAATAPETPALEPQQTAAQ